MKELEFQENLQEQFVANISPEEREKQQEFVFNPLVVNIVDINGNKYKQFAINDVAILRNTSQTSKFKIMVDGVVRMPEMMGDGVLVATPIGSTGYNMSINGPILPINSNLLAITPISPFRPRYWRGAMIDNSSKISIKSIDPMNRPVSLTADFHLIKDAADVDVSLDNKTTITLLFDSNMSIKERSMREQFMVYN